MLGKAIQLYLILFLHQTTTDTFILLFIRSCILFCFYIKPQRGGSRVGAISVVSYSVSTSNHNYFPSQTYLGGVVSYSVSTSNHNGRGDMFTPAPLYLILFLHQTTTISSVVVPALKCVSS